MKLVSWNVNGIRAVVKKDFFKSVEQLKPGIMCLQETKAQDEQVEEALRGLDGYNIYSNSAEKKGYSGTAVLSASEPLGVTKGIANDAHDKEGRVLTLEYDGFFLVNVYVPNSGSDLKRLGYRQEWDRDFFAWLKKLEEKKPVIACGDFNVAHKEIDLARPKPNYNKSAGFMQEEIDGMDRYTTGGFIDTFRHFYPGKRDVYSWWSYRAGARGKNVGWRIDYFLASEKLIPGIQKAEIHNEIPGSDHCPVSVEI
ncbi:MAG: exodeoxyribonuclease III [Bacteroidales bacterium]|nr:exodeoxyribonuclease III [Bacteroidales bacterium]